MADNYTRPLGLRPTKWGRGRGACLVQLFTITRPVSEDILGLFPNLFSGCCSEKTKYNYMSKCYSTTHIHVLSSALLLGFALWARHFGSQGLVSPIGAEHHAAWRGAPSVPDPRWGATGHVSSMPARPGNVSATMLRRLSTCSKGAAGTYDGQRERGPRVGYSEALRLQKPKKNQTLMGAREGSDLSRARSRERP